MNPETFEYMETYFDELAPKEFYRRLFGVGNLSEENGEDEYKLHGTILDLTNEDSTPHYELWNDLKAIEKVQGAGYFAAMAPCSYIGFKRTNGNARQLFALAIDLDYLKKNGVPSLFSQIDYLEAIPRPTYIVCSGNGLHLYYQFERPIPCYEYNRTKLMHYKAELTRTIWNSYVTEHFAKPEIESVFQPMRIVGSGTKDGAIVRAFETGENVTTQYLDTFVGPNYQIGNLEKRSSMPLSFWRLHDPEWYNERVQEKRPRKYWTCNRGLYDKWLQRVRKEAIVNHRYFAVMALAIYAIKSGVPYEELERDAYSLVPRLDALTLEENNHFTENDVKSALRAYNERYKTFPRYWIEQLCAISIPENRRNGRTQEEHLELARMARDQRQRKKGATWNGRKSKGHIVQEWRLNNPEGKKADCIRDTGLSKPTVYKYWEAGAAAAPESAPDWRQRLEKVKSISELMLLMDTLKGQELEEFTSFLRQHEEEIDELLAAFKLE